MSGTKGAVIGAILAAACLQWGFLGIFWIIVAAIIGMVVERWWQPNRENVMNWLRDGKRQINRGR